MLVVDYQQNHRTFRHTKGFDMKSIYACILIPIILLQPLFPQKTAPAYLTVSGHATFRNAYQRGNLDDWWSQQLGMPGEAADDGSPAFFAFEAGLSLPLTKR